MAVNDPVADFLTRIRNGVKAQHRYIDVSWSKMKESISEILKNCGFIEGFLVKRYSTARYRKSFSEIQRGQIFL